MAPEMTNIPRPGGIERLKEIMARLRAPDGGCPWGLEQNFATIAPYTIEEAYEVADAIEREDAGDLKDELGDLLFQVVYHAQMAAEVDQFIFDDVVEVICRQDGAPPSACLRRGRNRRRRSADRRLGDPKGQRARRCCQWRCGGERAGWCRQGLPCPAAAP